MGDLKTITAPRNEWTLWMSLPNWSINVESNHHTQNCFLHLLPAHEFLLKKCRWHTLLRGKLISKDKFISRQKSKKKQLSADLGPRGVTASLWNCDQPRPGSRETKLQSPCSIKSKLAGDDELQMWEARRGRPCTGGGFLPADLQLSEARRAPRLHPQSGLWLESWCYALDEDGLEI